MRTDALPALMRILHDDGELAGVEIFGDEVPEEHVTTVTEHPATAIDCILLQHSGGPGSNDYTANNIIRVDMRCYSDTPANAMVLYRKASEALKHTERIVAEDVLVHSVVESAGPSFGRDPDTKWPYYLSVWMCHSSETAT